MHLMTPLQRSHERARYRAQARRFGGILGCGALMAYLGIACSSGVEGLKATPISTSGEDAGTSGTGSSADAAGDVGGGGSDSANSGAGGTQVTSSDQGGGSSSIATQTGEGGNAPDAIGNEGGGTADDAGMPTDGAGMNGGEGGSGGDPGSTGTGGSGGSPDAGNPEGGGGGQGGNGGNGGNAGAPVEPDEVPEGCPKFGKSRFTWQLTEGDTNLELDLEADFGDYDGSDIVLGAIDTVWLQKTNPGVTGDVRLLLASSGVPYDTATDSLEFELSVRDRNRICATFTTTIDIQITNQLLPQATTGQSIAGARAAAWDTSSDQFYLLNPQSGMVVRLQTGVAQSLTTLTDISDAHQIAVSSDWLYVTVETTDGWQLRRLDKSGELDAEVALGYENIDNVSIAHAGSRLLVAIDDSEAALYADDGSTLALTSLSHTGLSQLASDDSAFAFKMGSNVHRATPSQLTGTLPAGCAMNGTGLSVGGTQLRWMAGSDLHAATASSACSADADVAVPSSSAPLTGLVSGLTLLLVDPSDGEFQMLDSGLEEYGLGVTLGQSVSPQAMVMSPNYALIVQDSGAPILIQL